jgi:single-stranded DNA-binding protein
MPRDGLAAGADAPRFTEEELRTIATPLDFVAIVGRFQHRSWTAEDGSAHSAVEVVAEELGPSLRWATATTTKATRSSSR